MSIMRSLMLLVPLIIILLSIPMILGKVPRNRLYGFRTAYTLSSDEVWYRANKISGIALLIAGVFWLVIGYAAPAWRGETARAFLWVQLLGVAALGVALAVSAWLTYRK
jgi:uncharacterized membrane protein